MRDAGLLRGRARALAELAEAHGSPLLGGARARLRGLGRGRGGPGRGGHRPHRGRPRRRSGRPARSCTTPHVRGDALGRAPARRGRGRGPRPRRGGAARSPPAPGRRGSTRSCTAASAACCCAWARRRGPRGGRVPARAGDRALRSRRGCSSCAPRATSPGCGATRGASPRRATCSRRSTRPSPRASPFPTWSRRGRCWRNSAARRRRLASAAGCGSSRSDSPG